MLAPKDLIYKNLSFLKIAKIVLMVIHLQLKLQLKLVDQLFDLFPLPAVNKSQLELTEQFLASLKFFLSLLCNAKFVVVWLQLGEEKLLIRLLIVQNGINEVPKPVVASALFMEESGHLHKHKHVLKFRKAK